MFKGKSGAIAVKCNIDGCGREFEWEVEILYDIVPQDDGTEQLICKIGYIDGSSSLDHNLLDHGIVDTQHIREEPN